MHHFVTYIKETGQITGTFRASTAEMLPYPPSPDQSIAEVTDPEQTKQLSGLRPREEKVAGAVKDGKVDLRLESHFKGRIVLTTDAPDRDGDQAPELPADGHTAAALKVRLTSLDGKPLAEAVPIRFTTTRGALSRRMVEAVKGAASIKLTAATETTRARVTASAPGFRPATLTFEFIPVEEYQAGR